MHLRRVRARRRRRAGAAARRAPRGAQQNLQADPRCSLLLQARDLDDRAAAVARDDRGHGDAGAQERADRVVLETQFGVRRGVELTTPHARRRAIVGPVRAELCTTQVAHPYADALLEDGRFDLWRVEPSEIFYVGGFGVGTTWVDKDDYTEAKPDAVAHEAVGLCKTLNGDKHAQDRSTIASTLLGLDDATTTLRVDGVDRLGLEVRVKTADSTDEYRIGFRVPGANGRGREKRNQQAVPGGVGARAGRRVRGRLRGQARGAEAGERAGPRRLEAGGEDGI